MLTIQIPTGFGIGVGMWCVVSMVELSKRSKFTFWVGYVCAWCGVGEWHGLGGGLVVYIF